ncbi:hypothetical protein AN1V17_08150 [Vallitalea sediminicola]
MKIFVAGPRAVTELSGTIISRIDNIIKQDFEILVGDANGIDSAIQKECFNRGYKLVKIYATNGSVRNNIGKWNVECVDVPKKLKGFEYYAAKDYQMAIDADYGFMIWNGRSKGTLNNMINLLKFDKMVMLYFIPDGKLYKISNINGLNFLVDQLDNDVKNLYEKFLKKTEQLTLSL